VAAARESRPDLVIMDIQLPKLSGLEATRQLSSAPETRHIPVIVITSFALAGDEQKAKDAGAAAYLAKPYSPRELMQMIRELAPDS
jgi:two-component system cell cycle response regulator DivK